MIYFQDDEDIKDDLVDDASPTHSGGEGDQISGSDSESQSTNTNNARVKKRKNRRLDM